MKKKPGTEAGTQSLWQQPGAEVKAEQSERAARGSVKRPAPRTVITNSLSKRRIPGSPGQASPMALDTGTVVTQLAPGLQVVVRRALKELLPDAVEKVTASGGKIRAERATEQATKKEREARERVLKHEATIARLLEAAEDMARKAKAGKVKAEALLAEKAAECDRVLSILNRTYRQGPSPSK